MNLIPEKTHENRMQKIFDKNRYPMTHKISGYSGVDIKKVLSKFPEIDQEKFKKEQEEIAEHLKLAFRGIVDAISGMADAIAKVFSAPGMQEKLKYLCTNTVKGGLNERSKN